MPLLDPQIVEDKLDALPHWEYIENEITRNFVLTDFRTAIRFVDEIANLAEDLDHHPDMLIHSWNNVTVTLATHSEGGLTELDFELAEKIQNLYNSF